MSIKNGLPPRHQRTGHALHRTPAPTSSVTLDDTYEVSRDTFDGMLETYRRGVDCSGQSEGGDSNAIFIVKDGGTWWKESFQTATIQGLIRIKMRSLTSATLPSNAMLFASSLPTGTPTAIGSTVCGIKKYIALQLELHTTCYVHFTNVPPAIVRRSDDHPIEIFGVKEARIYYDEGARDLIVKLVEKPHEVAHGAFTKKLLGQAFTMNLDSELSLDGATRVTSRGISKEPDASFSPWTLPPGRSRHWPAVVIECGYSESTNHLRAMANLWISNSNGDVKLAIIISIERPRAKIILEKWIPTQPARSMGPLLRTRGQHARCEQGIVITRNEDGSAAISGAPLVIHFEEMFLRALVPPNEHDFVITGADLESIAREIWRVTAYLVSAQ